MKELPGWIRIKQCSKIITQDVTGRENGFLIDILNRNDSIFYDRQSEQFQQVYYSSVYKGMFKGFHIHPYKYDTVFCIYGKALLVLYPQVIAKEDLNIDIENLIILPLDTQDNIMTVSFPSKYPHGYYGVSGIAFILNYRNPAWHPEDTYQYDYKIFNIERILNDWVDKNAYS